MRVLTPARHSSLDCRLTSTICMLSPITRATCENSFACLAAETEAIDHFGIEFEVVVHEALNVHAARLTSEHPARNGIELFDQLGIASLRRRDQRGVERTIRTGRARLMFTRK